MLSRRSGLTTIPESTPCVACVADLHPTTARLVGAVAIDRGEAVIEKWRHTL